MQRNIRTRAHEWRDRYVARVQEAADKHDWEKYQLATEVVHVLEMVLAENLATTPTISHRIPFKFLWEVEQEAANV